MLRTPRVNRHPLGVIPSETVTFCDILQLYVVVCSLFGREAWEQARLKLQNPLMLWDNCRTSKWIISPIGEPISFLSVSSSP
jgi:hypothetical protein